MTKLKVNDIVINRLSSGFMDRKRYGITILKILNVSSTLYTVQTIRNETYPDSIGDVKTADKHALEQSYEKIGKNTVTNLCRELYVR